MVIHFVVAAETCIYYFTAIYFYSNLTTTKKSNFLSFCSPSFTLNHSKMMRFCFAVVWPSCHASAVACPNITSKRQQVLLCKAMVCIAELMAFKMSKGNVAHRKKKKTLLLCVGFHLELYYLPATLLQLTLSLAFSLSLSLQRQQTAAMQIQVDA